MDAINQERERSLRKQVEYLALLQKELLDRLLDEPQNKELQKEFVEARNLYIQERRKLK